MFGVLGVRGFGLQLLLLPRRSILQVNECARASLVFVKIRAYNLDRRILCLTMREIFLW